MTATSPQPTTTPQPAGLQKFWAKPTTVIRITFTAPSCLNFTLHRKLGCHTRHFFLIFRSGMPLVPGIHHNQFCCDMCSIIQFNFVLEEGRLNVLLEADVQEDVRGIFTVNNFRIPGHKQTDILPEICIKKVDGHWVHRDSGWQTALSEAAGTAIEKTTSLSPPPNTTH